MLGPCITYTSTYTSPKFAKHFTFIQNKVCKVHIKMPIDILTAVGSLVSTSPSYVKCPGVFSFFAPATGGGHDTNRCFLFVHDSIQLKTF